MSCLPRLPVCRQTLLATTMATLAGIIITSPWPCC